MPLKDQTIHRVYACTDPACEAKICYKETVGDPWRKLCPFCNKESLILDSAHLDLSTIMDLSKPKTIGTLGEKNYREAVKQGKIQPKKKFKPFWRKKDKIDFSILKNPNNYIQTGHI